MSAKTLYDKLWDSHLVLQDEAGTALIYIDRHLIHEVTSPQAFEGLRLAVNNVHIAAQGNDRSHRGQHEKKEKGGAGTGVYQPEGRQQDR